MTSPQDPTTAQDLLHRVDSLRNEPHRTEVILDFGRFPIADVPYLVIEKWALSSDDDWPLMALRRAAVDERMATRGLSDDEVRTVLYDDLKRSLWRPLPAGLSLGWDDDRLMLTVAWSPRERPEGHPAFATLGSTLSCTDANLLIGEPDSASAFAAACATAAGPTSQPKPAFRVHIGGLTLPAESYPGFNEADRRRQLYLELRDAVATISQQQQFPDDPGVRFLPETRTIEFDDYSSLYRSGVRAQVLQLARLPIFGTPSTHAGAPAPGLRRYPSAEEGAEQRTIEHAFAVPAYRAYRQARRRDLTAGQSYAVIARAYHDYDTAITEDRMRQVDETLLKAQVHGGYLDAFRDLFQHGGAVIGERHSNTEAFLFATRHMAALKEAGLIAFVCETFKQEDQPDLDEFIFGESHKMGGSLPRYVTTLDRVRDPRGQHHDIENFLWTARKHGLQVVGAEHGGAYYSSGAGRINNRQNAFTYDEEKRLAHYNWAAAERSRNQRGSSPPIVLHITGRGHVHTQERGYPGIAQLLCLPAVEIARDTKYGLYAKQMRERRHHRMTAVPTHTGPVTPVNAPPPRATTARLGGQNPHENHQAATRGLGLT